MKIGIASSMELSNGVLVVFILLKLLLAYLLAGLDRGVEVSLWLASFPANYSTPLIRFLVFLLLERQ